MHHGRYNHGEKIVMKRYSYKFYVLNKHLWCCNCRKPTARSWDACGVLTCCNCHTTNTEYLIEMKEAKQLGMFVLPERTNTQLSDKAKIRKLINLLMDTNIVCECRECSENRAVYDDGPEDTQHEKDIVELIQLLKLV